MGTLAALCECTLGNIYQKLLLVGAGLSLAMQIHV